MSGVSAASPRPHDQTDPDHRSLEPSMEEILASIRRIISDDQMLPLAPRMLHSPTVALGQSATPAANRSHVTDSGKIEPAFDEPNDGFDHVSQQETMSEDGIDAANRHGTEVSTESQMHDRSNVGRHTTPTEASIRQDISSLGDLDHTTLQHDPINASVGSGALSGSHDDAEISGKLNAEMEHNSDSSDETILSEHTKTSVASSFHQLAATMLMQNFPPVEEIARELLRPMLKTWLDDNLPVVVERLVRAEIERVSRGVR